MPKTIMAIQFCTIVCQSKYKPNIVIEVMKILIENGASIDQKAMDLASMSKHKQILEYLTETKRNFKSKFS